MTLADRQTDAIIDAALAAGRAILEVYATDFDVKGKSDASPVTEADQRAEAIILDRLRAALPDVPVIAEEEIAAGRVPEIGRRFFLVDPLDGTREFIARRDEFTVNIALIENGAPVMGIVYAPAISRLYYGADGAAFEAEIADDKIANKRSITVRPSSREAVTIVASRSHRTPETNEFIARYPGAELVSAGSSLKFCLIAGGQADLYPRLGPTMEWDTAAGHAVLAAAGGTVTQADLSPLIYGKPTIPGLRPFENPWFIASGDPALHAGI